MSDRPGSEEITCQTRRTELIELVGVSEVSIEAAIQNAITRANQTLQNLDWFEVVETRGMIADGGVSQFQVKLKVGFRLAA
ncbi:MAG: dodecin [Dehalococcoidia bacterium]|nr:dodecin [Dehalococcoidia bacterium]